MKCKILSCNFDRTPFQGSDMCLGHTCYNWNCKNQKSLDNKEYCDSCRCVVKDCELQKSYNSIACYIHKCKRCSKNFFSDNDEKKCDECIVLCNDLFCKKNRIENGTFCSLHTCEIDDCFQQRYMNKPFNGSENGERYCREYHGCNKCHEYRGDSTDPQYCNNCLNKCFFYKNCTVIKPHDHQNRFYYCNEHGCIQCNSMIKHTFTFLREKLNSEYCKNHYLCSVDGCRWYKINKSLFCKKHGIVEK